MRGGAVAFAIARWRGELGEAPMGMLRLAGEGLLQARLMEETRLTACGRTGEERSGG